LNRSIRKIAAALAVLFAAIFLNLNYVQVVKGSDYRNAAGNKRVLLNEYASPRGAIVVGGTNVAVSKSTKDELKYLRVYPDGAMYAPVTGYYSYIYGRSGIEQSEDDVLSGNDPRLFGTQLSSLLTGRNPKGGSVELTLNKAAQRAAYKAMKANGKMRRGAVVALDPTTGAILAAVSTPSYDPSVLSSHNANSIEKAWKQLNANKKQPMLNRAFRQLYPPGSTFKIVVAAAALKAGYAPDSKVFAPVGYWPFQPKKTSACPADVASSCVQNFEGESCASGTKATLEFALAKSCNTAFAALAVDKLGGDRIADMAERFGFADPYADTENPPDFCDPPGLQVPLPVCNSTVGSNGDLADPGALSHTSFGQQDAKMTPLQGAMLSAAVANNGVLMQPYLVAKELSPNLSTLSQTQPHQLSQVLTPDLDAELRQMMQAVVEAPEGTGGPAQITDLPDITVGGKTGTADTGQYSRNSKTQPDAWFTGYALQAGQPKIAVAVILENAGVSGDEVTGGLAAAPVAKAVMEAYLRSGGAH
jgi:peptidoglycan glycosyltransferase